MNDRNIHALALEELWKQDIDGYLPVLFEIYNPDIKWDDDSLEQENMYLRIINDSNPVWYKGKKYIPCHFEFTPPSEDGKSLGAATASISAIDNRVVQLLRSIQVQCEVNVVAAFAKADTTYRFLPMENYKFEMQSATYNATTATFNLINRNVMKLNVPRDIATKNRLPSVNVDG